MFVKGTVNVSSSHPTFKMNMSDSQQYPKPLPERKL